VATEEADPDAVDDGAAEELHPVVMIATAAGAASHAAARLREDCLPNTRRKRRRRLNDLKGFSRLFIGTTSAVEHGNCTSGHNNTDAQGRRKGCLRARAAAYPGR
jgi:hypothetical protein